MGEVYRARDAELERDVAIKVLPPSFAGDADRVARFEQEAKTLAALDHPNVAHIYGIARGDGGREQIPVVQNRTEEFSAWCRWTDSEAQAATSK
jgi:serine/threonine protein kinase